MDNSTKLRINQFLERTIADRTQGDDIIHSLKFAVSQTLNTLENIITEDFFPSFNILCFLFTYLLESTTAIYKQEVCQLLNLYLKKYYESTSESTKEFDKFLDICVLNVTNFIDKYKTTELHMKKTNIRIEQSIKHTLSNSHLSAKKIKHNKLNFAESNRSKMLKQRKYHYNTINADEKHCTDQFFKYLLLQESSSINNDQIDFVLTNHLDNYSVYIQGELLFYLNFYNYELLKSRTVNKSNNNYLFSKIFNYLLYLEEDYITFGVQGQRESNYAAFTTFLKVCSIRSHKDPVFLMHLFYPSYQNICDREILKSIAKTIFLFVGEATDFLKAIKFDNKSKLTYWHDMVLDYVEICFVICFQFLRYMKNLPKYGFHEHYMENLIDKFFAHTYENMIDSPHSISTLFDFYVLDKIINFKDVHFEGDCKLIKNLKVYFASHVKKHSVK